MMILLINFILKMTLFFSICCFTICFAPSLMLFRRIIVSDPLRIILFVLGAFFWLLSLLFTSLIWAISSDYLLVPVFASVLFQELARGLYYYLLYKAQGGLAKLATDGVDVSGVRLMFSSRHVLAIVCGLGMGVMAALILLTNILADYSDDGVVGLPAAMKDNSSEFELHISDAYFPIYYSLACALLTMFNVVWTITLWDGLHRFFHKLGGLWHICILLTLLSHFMNTTMSIWQRYEPIPVLILQAVLLVGHTFYAAMLVKNLQFHQLFQKERTAGEQQPQPTQRNMNE